MFVSTYEIFCDNICKLLVILIDTPVQTHYKKQVLIVFWLEIIEENVFLDLNKSHYNWSNWDKTIRLILTQILGFTNQSFQQLV